MAHSTHRQWKGCPLCKMHKHKGNGDFIRTPYSVMRKIGKARRYNRNEAPTEE